MSQVMYTLCVMGYCVCLFTWAGSDPGLVSNVYLDDVL